jgi:hypothetical protein
MCTSKEGDTSEIDVASLSTLTHVATYIRGSFGGFQHGTTPWSPRAPLVDPSWEFPALRVRFSRVLSHVSEEGDTSEIDVASLSTLTHVATYIRGEVIALWGFLLFSGSTYTETLARWARAVYPFDFPPTTIGRWIFLLYFVWLGYRST